MTDPITLIETSEEIAGRGDRWPGMAALARYLGHEAPLPILVLFALNAVDEFDTRTFELLGPEIADHFGVGRA